MSPLLRLRWQIAGLGPDAGRIPGATAAEVAATSNRTRPICDSGTQCWRTYESHDFHMAMLRSMRLGIRC